VPLKQTKLGRVDNQEKSGWTLRRFLNALKVSPPWARQKVVLAGNTLRYFLRFVAGNVEGIAGAPAAAKWGLMVRYSRRPRSMKLSPLPSSDDIWLDAVQAYEAAGVWPISFSYPRPLSALSSSGSSSSSSSSTMCPVFPGHRYAFTNEADYISNYGSFSFALTHKKGGWDCFRHLEIIYAGAVPFMPDASLIPEFTMVHYPKTFLAEVAAGLRHSRVVVMPQDSQELARYFNYNLTSAAMARYVLRAAAIDNDAKVLFIDAAAVSMPDYQSVFTLIGLKQTLGKRVSVAFPLDYLYEDWAGDAAALYGRGFGYSRVLETKLKNRNEISGDVLDLSAASLATFDAVVVGSVTRNAALAEQLLARFPASKTIWIHGEDKGPSAYDIATFRAKGITAFVREMG
jgi:hypothetical protein